MPPACTPVGLELVLRRTQPHLLLLLLLLRVRLHCASKCTWLGCPWPMDTPTRARAPAWS